MIPGLIDSHCHVVLGDYTPRQKTVDFLDSYVHGGITSVVSAGEGVHAPGRPHDPVAAKALAIAAAKCFAHFRPNGMKVNAGSVVLEPGTHLGATQIGLLAAVGRERVLARPRPRVVVLSTGVIGATLPMDQMLAGVGPLAAALSAAGGDAAATAILTTDSGPKTAAVSRDGFTVGGMAKGAGMIHPCLATMLAVVTTDYPLGPGEASAFLAPAVHASFNRISVDGECSTNDAVVLLANGACGIAHRDSATDEAFAAALEQRLQTLTPTTTEQPEGGRGSSQTTGMPRHLREIGTGGQILRALGLRHLRLISNHPHELPGLEGFGLEIDGWLGLAEMSPI